MTESTVLIADDELMIRELYEKVFTDAGITVLTATDGEECVTLALQHRPDVILVDINMPKLNGHEAVARIRKDDWGKTANVIYLTNLSDAENVVSAVANKTEEYIVKANTDVQEVLNKARLAMHSS